MQASEVREMTIREIEEKLTESYQELFNLRFQTVVSQVRDYSRIRVVKRDIVRMKTIAHQKTREAGEEQDD